MLWEATWSMRKQQVKASCSLTLELNTNFEHPPVWLHLEKPHRREVSFSLSLLCDLYVFVLLLLLPPCKEWKIASDHKLVFTHIANATVQPSGEIKDNTSSRSGSNMGVMSQFLNARMLIELNFWISEIEITVWECLSRKWQHESIYKNILFTKIHHFDFGDHSSIEMNSLQLNRLMKHPWLYQCNYKSILSKALFSNNFTGQ